MLMLTAFLCADIRSSQHTVLILVTLLSSWQENWAIWDYPPQEVLL